MTDLTEILRELANEPEWTKLSTKFVNCHPDNQYDSFMCERKGDADFAIASHNRLVAKNRALVEVLEIAVAKFNWITDGTEDDGTYNGKRIKAHQVLADIADKLADALSSL